MEFARKNIFTTKLLFVTIGTMHSYRYRYGDNQENMDYLIWNAAISKSFLKNKALTVKFIGHDLLQQFTNKNSRITPYMMTESWNNRKSSYGMLTLSYELNAAPQNKKGAKK